jgi:hypothetical protein
VHFEVKRNGVIAATEEKEGVAGNTAGRDGKGPMQPGRDPNPAAPETSAQITSECTKRIATGSPCVRYVIGITIHSLRTAPQ